jgi:hypothetical protein
VSLVHWIALSLSALLAPPAIAPEIVWVDVARLSPMARDAALREASEVLARVGLAPRWRVTAPGAVLSDDRLVVVLVAEDRAGSGRTGRVLGACRRQQRARVWIYLENVAWTLGMPDVRRPRPGEALRIGRAIGRIVAHEVIHAAAPDLGHARHGVMAASFGRRELLTNRLDVDEQTVQAVRRSLAVQRASLTPPRS